MVIHLSGSGGVLPFIHTHALPFIYSLLNPAVPAGIHRSVQSPTPLSVRMDVCLENRLNMYTRFHPFGLMSGLMSEHLAEGVYFQSHIRITLQINNEFPALVSLLRQVAACCADWHHSAHLCLCQTRIYHPNFAPERQGTQPVAQPGV